MEDILYTDALWKEWSEKELENYSLVKDPETGKLKKRYLKKGYLHFDSRFWFPKDKDQIKMLLSNPARVTKRAFHSFLKVTLNTPRYKIDSKTGKRSIKYKARPICFASHIDALIFSFYSYCLTKIYEEYIKCLGIDECVLAYRTDLGACNIDFARDVFEYINNKGPCTAIALDVTGFFDNLNHVQLKEKWLKVLKHKRPCLVGLPEDQFKLYKTLTEFAYVKKNTLLKYAKVKLNKLPKQPNTLLEILQGKRDFEKYNHLRSHNILATNSRKKGIPQGSPISALLSNIYMIDFDKRMKTLADKKGFLYRRYCDDILIVCDTEDAAIVKAEAYNKIDECKLTIQQSKEEEIQFRFNKRGELRGYNARALELMDPSEIEDNELKLYKYLQYLGFEFNGNKIGIRSSSHSRYNRKMKASVTKTVKMAYSPRSKGKRIFKKKLLHRYTHLGKRNFISYAKNAASSTYLNADKLSKQGMNSPAIRKQVSRHFKNMLNDLEKKKPAEDRIQTKGSKIKTNKILILYYFCTIKMHNYQGLCPHKPLEHQEPTLFFCPVRAQAREKNTTSFVFTS